MSVLGVSSKLRQPAVGSKPIHTALPIPHVGKAMSQQYPSRSLELIKAEKSLNSCQLMLKPSCDFDEKKTFQGNVREAEDRKVSKPLHKSYPLQGEY